MPKAPAQKKSQTTREKWLLALRVVGWGCVAAGLAWGGKQVESFLVKDPRFALECETGLASCSSLEIRGATYSNRARILSVFEPDYGKSLALIPLAERRRRLLAIDWVNSATVMRVWPNKLVVSITERRPVAFAKIPATNGRYRMLLVDPEGVLLSIPTRVRFRLPLVSGLTEDQKDADRKVRVHAMEHLLGDLGPEAKNVSEVNAASVQDMRLIADMDGRAVELWIGDQHYRSRFVNFLKYYEQMRKNSDAANVFDLRMDDRISVTK